MLETRIFTPPISLLARNLQYECLEISRLLAAAVINPGFCKVLLNNPEQALDRGFQGEYFSGTNGVPRICRSHSRRQSTLASPARLLDLGLPRPLLMLTLD